MLHIIFEKSNNADRDVAEDIFNLYNTEAVIQQGVLYDEAQRTLGHDDVAGIRYAMSGLDELAGTPDDYTISLTYAGLNPFANITIGFNHTRTSFASTFVNSPPPYRILTTFVLMARQFTSTQTKSGSSTTTCPTT